MQWEGFTVRSIADSAVGYLLALAAFGFGIVAFILGLMSRDASTTWYLSAAILAILGVGIVVDESRMVPGRPKQLIEGVLGYFLSLFAFCVGVVGFIAGLVMGSSHSLEWLISGIILALAAVAVAADEGRRQSANIQNVADEVVGTLFVLLAIGMGIVGFIIGVMHTGGGNTWLYGGVISGIVSVAFMFDAERRAAFAAARQQARDLSTHGAYHQPLR
jgi:hypothetical protein